MKKFCLIAFIVFGFLVFYAPQSYADAEPKKIYVTKKFEEFGVKTTLYGGNTEKALHDYLLPLYKKLAGGKISGDKITWKFEDSPFYVEETYKESAVGRMENFAYFYTQNGGKTLYPAVGETPAEMWSVLKMGYSTETREVSRPEGNKYRSVITSVFVTNWCTPNGVACSRKTAMSYYQKYEKRLKTAVSKIMKLRYKGKSLNTVQKLKAIHDFLTSNVEYDYAGLNAFNNGDQSQKQIYNEYGAIVRGKAVCGGYALAFKCLADELNRQTGSNIKCEYVRCSRHAWNRVKLGSNWYHIDATWDDGAKKTKTRYFLVSDKSLLEKHPGGEDGYRTYNPEKATNSSYEGKKWPLFKLGMLNISGTAKSTKAYKLGRKKKVTPFNKVFKPFASVYRYSKKSISENLQGKRSLVLIRGLDYTIKYSLNYKKGWATAIITLKGDYSGKIKVKFKIVK